eukprot:746678-Hanusia_phi.AAC.1
MNAAARRRIGPRRRGGPATVRPRPQADLLGPGAQGHRGQVPPTTKLFMFFSRSTAETVYPESPTRLFPEPGVTFLS